MEFKVSLKMDYFQWWNFHVCFKKDRKGHLDLVLFFPEILEECWIRFNS